MAIKQKDIPVGTAAPLVRSQGFGGDAIETAGKS